MTIRKASKAGSWYRAGAQALAADIDDCLQEGRRRYGAAHASPGMTPVAGVVPHAGLAFSGPIAALVFNLIREAAGKIDTIVVFGACHRALLSRPAVWPDGAWETPLGPIEVDADFAAALLAADAARPDTDAHLDDNAIELQTPFIKRMFPGTKIAPIAISPTPDAWRAGEQAFGLAEGSGKHMIAVASTDLTHYGAAFGLMPVGAGPQAVTWTRENDAPFLAALERLDLPAIVPASERDCSACGGGAAAAAAGWARAAGATRGRLLAHDTSHEIMPRGEAEHLVGYAGMVFEAAGEGCGTCAAAK